MKIKKPARLAKAQDVSREEQATRVIAGNLGAAAETIFNSKSKAVRRGLERDFSKLAKAFDESKVRRDDEGQFAPKGAGGAPSMRQATTISEPRGRQRLIAGYWGKGKNDERTRGKLDLRALRLKARLDQHEASTKRGDYTAGLKSAYLRDKIEAAEYARDTVPEIGALTERNVKVQVPKAVGEERHGELVQRLQRQVGANMRPSIERATERGLIPENTPIGDVKRAYKHAALLAMHDQSVIDYDFKMTDDEKARYEPLVPFMRYTRRRLKSELTGQNKGAFKPYRAEFGQPFPSPKYDKRTGEERLRARPNQEFVKADLLVVGSWADLEEWIDGQEVTAADDLASRILTKAQPREWDGTFSRKTREMVGTLAGGAALGAAGLAAGRRFGPQIGQRIGAALGRIQGTRVANAFGASGMARDAVRGSYVFGGQVKGMSAGMRHGPKVGAVGGAVVGGMGGGAVGASLDQRSRTKRARQEYQARVGDGRMTQGEADAATSYYHRSRGFSRRVEKADGVEVVQLTDILRKTDDSEGPLGQPQRTPGGPKKFMVRVRDPQTGNVKTVRFGDPNMEIKRDDPERRKNFRARHGCDDPGPRTKAKYWSCRMWAKKPVSQIAD